LKNWLAKLKLKEFPLTKHAKVCSAHFEPDCYIRDLQSELINSKPKQVVSKKDAIPTIFDYGHVEASTSKHSNIPSSSLKSSSKKTQLLRKERRNKRAQVKKGKR